jgi:DNA-binding GntR family transcriptional regulator
MWCAILAWMSNEPATSFASQRVVEHLRAQILSGELPPDARIRQDEVAAELGSSRLPVREALQILRHQGLVTLRPNAGARVMSFDADECSLIYRVREQVEPIVLAESAPHLDAATLTALDELQRKIEANRDAEHFLELDRQFHRMTYSGCPMDSMLELVDRFWDTTQHYRRTYAVLIGVDGMWKAHAEHRLLLDALRGRDAEMAGHVLAGHIRRTRLHLARERHVFAGLERQDVDGSQN